MVFTRSGKSSIQSGSSSSSSPFVHSQSTKISRRRTKEDKDKTIDADKLLKINKNANRLSHNHIRFELIASPVVCFSSFVAAPAPIEEVAAPDSNFSVEQEPVVQLPVVSTPPKSANKRELIDECSDNGKSVAPASAKKLRSATKQTPKRKSLTAPKSLRKSLSKIGIKKLEISADEKNMNGAPEGELYDVVLLPDSELFPLEMPKENVFSFLCTILESFHSLDSKAQWAKQYEITTNLRQIFLHHFTEAVSSHPAFEESKENCLKMILKLFLVNLSSLRSSNSRNALLAIQQFFRSNLIVSAFISVEDPTRWRAVEEFGQIVQQLVIKSGNNPKFLAIEAFQTLSEITAQSYPLGLLLDSLFTEGNLLNKNLEISGNAVQLFQEKLLKEFSQRSLPVAQVLASFSKQNVMKLVYLAYSQAKKSQSKEKMRILLKQLWNQEYQADSDRMAREILSPYLSEAQVEEIKREVLREKDSADVVEAKADENSQPNKIEIKRTNLTAKPWKAVGSLPVAAAASKPSSFAAMRQQMKASMKREGPETSQVLDSQILL